MKTLLAGASGFIGSALASELSSRGHTVQRLVRHVPTGPDEFGWDPESGTLDGSVLAGVDAVVCLSGAGIGDKRWTPSYKKLLLDSRVGPTRTIATALAALPAADRPTTFVSASAIGFYGERGDETLAENAPAGRGFLADLVVQWEAAARPAVEAGVRVSYLRTGLVLSAGGGLVKRLVPLFKAGIGGSLGSGQQYQSWISLADEVAAIAHVLTTSAISGPVNVTAPAPVRNKEFSATLASVLKRPALVPTPAFALRLALGEFADEGVLVSQRVIPEVLTDGGYSFQHRELRTALEWALQD